MFSERSAIGHEGENAWTRVLAARRASGAPLIDLTLSNPTQVGLPYPGEAIVAALANPSTLHYEPHARGLESARAALVEAGLAPHAERVVLTASTSEAYTHLFALLADPGDEILVPAPSYPLLAHLAHTSGVHLRPYALAYDGRWEFEATDLFEAISDRTRAIVAVSPNNPTGSYLDGDALDALSALELPLIVDEVFHAYPLEAPAERARAFTRDECLVFSLDGLSKRAALPQVKLGWINISGPEAAVSEALARLDLLTDALLSPNAMVQAALPRLLELMGPVRDAITKRTAANLRALRELVEGTPASLPRVEGGWYAPLRLPATRTDEEHAISALDAGVAVHPGYFYDFPQEEAWLVLGLLTPEDDFAEGARRIIDLIR